MPILSTFWIIISIYIIELYMLMYLDFKKSKNTLRMGSVHSFNKNRILSQFLTRVFFPIHSMFRYKVSYFIVERDFSKKNFVCQRYNFWKENVCLQVFTAAIYSSFQEQWWWNLVDKVRLFSLETVVGKICLLRFLRVGFLVCCWGTCIFFFFLIFLCFFVLFCFFACLLFLLFYIKVEEYPL